MCVSQSFQTRFYPKYLWIVFGLVLYSKDIMWIRDVLSSKDNPDQPLEISDKQITDKMLSSGQKASDNAAVAAAAGSRSNTDNRDAKKDASVLEPTGAPDDLQKELVDDLKRQHYHKKLD